MQAPQVVERVADTCHHLPDVKEAGTDQPAGDGRESARLFSTHVDPQVLAKVPDRGVPLLGVRLGVVLKAEVRRAPFTQHAWQDLLCKAMKARRSSRSAGQGHVLRLFSTGRQVDVSRWNPRRQQSSSGRLDGPLVVAGMETLLLKLHGPPKGPAPVLPGFPRRTSSRECRAARDLSRSSRDSNRNFIRFTPTLSGFANLVTEWEHVAEVCATKDRAPHSPGVEDEDRVEVCWLQLERSLQRRIVVET